MVILYRLSEDDPNLSDLPLYRSSSFYQKILASPIEKRRISNHRRGIKAKGFSLQSVRQRAGGRGFAPHTIQRFQGTGEIMPWKRSM
ncbi:hypothetical protein SELSPUOL_01962 [Selenomonas sputigena ATCC 35185]|uniref:Uncharacterized protein n=1 Tax=Selenomonas sputigena (strain ATCC 35185 / DSM 20758 / CCUG 44933 / VPI D19B-28) TaxID=546271 RepID=C9LWV8_SELS3|nr:hypothetical protein SELSPUOL_01962 [Selenomonas sputigena ATCC 35185]